MNGVIACKARFSLATQLQTQQDAIANTSTRMENIFPCAIVASDVIYRV